VTGGSFPAEIWRLFMEPALEGTEPEAFPEPRVWPEWTPFTRGDFALSYDPNASQDTETETSTETETTKTKPTPPAPSRVPGDHGPCRNC